MVLLDKAEACLRYSYSLLRHKYFVYKAGVGSVSLWRLLKHDASKFTPAEFVPYALFFYGEPFGLKDPVAFKKAWKHHKAVNDHHYEYWELETDGMISWMPIEVIREMVADWFGAARAYNGEWPFDLEKWDWFQETGKEVLTRMSVENRAEVLVVIRETQDRLRAKA